MFKGFRDLGKMASMFKQAGQMNERMQAAQEKLKELRVTGAAGGGLVRVEMDGAGQAVGVTVDPRLLAVEEKELLEELLLSAMNEAQVKSREAQMQSVQDAMGLGDLMSQMGAAADLDPEDDD